MLHTLILLHTLRTNGTDDVTFHHALAIVPKLDKSQTSSGPKAL